LSADPTQGFLKRRLSWLAAGIDVRGRSTRLGRPYRTTRRILAFATRLYQLHHPGDGSESSTEGTDLASAANLATITEAGSWPEVVPVTTPREEINEAVARIVRIRNERPDLAGRILLLHADSNALTDLTTALQHALGADQVRDAKDLSNPGGSHFCTISTLNAATGLEAAIVLVLGLDRILEKERDPRLDAANLAELQADHAKMLYVACTRAARRLVVFSRSDEFTRLLQQAILEGQELAQAGT
jgi:superfamily I DNA and RNA helicase